MPRPVTVSTERIIDAARTIFLEKGYQETTTAAIAQRAGVSEGSLFKRFPGKAQLFCAAMDLPSLDFLDHITALSGKGDARKNLREICLLMLNFIEGLLPKLMMLWSQRKMMMMPPPPGAPPLV